MRHQYFCVIPARAGSKRLPRKNILPLAGKPMIAYSIQAAISAGLFSEVYVATESEEIAQVAREHGANVPFLVPEELCGDLQPSHVPCRFLAKRLGRDLPEDVLVCLQPTSPLRSRDDIQRAVRAFEEKSPNFLVSVTPVDPHYFHWALECSAEAEGWRMFFGDKYMVERPLLPPVFRPNGSLKLATFEALDLQGNFFGDGLAVVETPEERSVHVAAKFDFELCEFMVGKRSK